MMGLYVAALSFLLFFALHLAAWWRLPAPRRSVALMTAIALAAYPLAVGFALSIMALSIQQHLFVSGPVYAFLTMLYFHFYYGLDRSVSVRTLGELSRAPGASLSMEKLAQFYPKESMVDRRLEIMIEHGYLELDNGRYRCTPKARQMARLVGWAQHLYRLDITG
jgi:hypothetical protein